MRNKTRRTIAATEAAKTFGALVDRVRESGATYQIESRGQVVAEIAPPRRKFTVGDFILLMNRIERAPEDLLVAIEDTRAEARRIKPSPTVKLTGRGGRKAR